MSSLVELLGTEGVEGTLHYLESSSVTNYSADDIRGIMLQQGVGDPQITMGDFIAENLLYQDGQRYIFTTFGIKMCLLLEAINGGDLKEIYWRLSRVEPSLQSYELIREGMSKFFIRNLCDRPGFGRLFFCSPWISLDRKRAAMLTYAIVQAERRRGAHPEILVITRPDKGKNEKAIPIDLKPFRDLGASIFFHKRLHTKLYIREPDSHGGYSMAIVGSENLTRSNNLELGIKITSDSILIDQLVAYFLELTNYSLEG